MLAQLYLLGTGHVRDAAGSTVLTFVGTFGVSLLAERVGLSPIITMVTYGLSHALLVSGAVLVTVIVVRIAYVMAYNTIARVKNRWFGSR